MGYMAQATYITAATYITQQDSESLHNKHGGHG